MAIRNHEHKLVEPMVYQGTATEHTVYAYFKTILPNLKIGSIVILDNASYHKSEQLLKLFHSHKISLLFLPPYSPDLIPIENLWGTNENSSPQSSEVSPHTPSPSNKSTAEFVEIFL
jgi:transposase